jgi:hypothetical protein
MKTNRLRHATVWLRQGYILVTLAMAIGFLLIQWLTHDGTFREFVNAVMENLQSEAFQLVWQVLGLGLLLAVGSPQSRETDDRMERKLDLLLKAAGAAEQGREIDLDHGRFYE